MTRRILLVLLAAVVAFGASRADGDGTAQTREPGCKGHVATIDMPRDRYPAIVDHVEDSWRAGYPVVLRVNREGAKERRDRLLGWWEHRHPQPKGDALDLDEAPAAALRSSWRADVRPIDEHENRAAGAKLGAELRGLRDGTCVRYAFGGR
jgi:hypothetical protein